YQGNIRELRNILTRATVLANTNIIDCHVLDQCFKIHTHKEIKDLNLKNNERLYLSQLLEKHHQDKEKVAQIAGISVRSLYRKLSE
ncbi:MAG: AAA family ATPase, partial [Gammaproteobacteria bacterium]|nr:AAA family ATPase [Gammaproteobacteria bacterium]